MANDLTPTKARGSRRDTVSVGFEVNNRQWSNVLALLGGVKKDATRAVVGALNDVGSTVKTRIDSRMRNQVAIKKRDIAKSMTLQKANFSKPVATIRIKGRRIPLINFKVTPRTPWVGGQLTKKGNKRRRPTLKYSIRKLGKGEKKQELPGAFVAKMPSGHLGVFKRGTSGNIRRIVKTNKFGSKYFSELPIHELHGPSLPALFQNRLNGIQQDATGDVEARIADRLAARTELIIKKRAKKK